MIQTVIAGIGVGVTLGGAIGAILCGFFKSNKDAEKEHKALREELFNEIKYTKGEVQGEVKDLKVDLNDKLNNLEKRFEHELEVSNTGIKLELQKISEKIDGIKTRYVTSDNFKTYVDSISQLLKMSTDRMTRIESTLDDIRDDVNTLIRTQNNIE
jgi:phage host-nuclease inhibitor protein Gam